MDNPEQAKKLFVLDTNVLIHDPSSIFRFEEHDVYLPMLVLEELDKHKHGLTEVARNARQASRYIDELIQDNAIDVQKGVPLPTAIEGYKPGLLYLQGTSLGVTLPDGLAADKADNQILGVVLELAKRLHPREVILVSKDINMRIKARTLGLVAEDYFNDQVLRDTDLLYTGFMALPEDFWQAHKIQELPPQNGLSIYRLQGPLCLHFLVNQFLFDESQAPFYGRVRNLEGDSALIEEAIDYTGPKNNVWGVRARNREQNFALNLLMDPEIDFVTLLGQAGTGKTLLALASSLSLVLEKKLYEEIIMTRATVPVGEDIGFLPGTEEEKMIPWMGALEDNLEVLQQSDGAGDWGRAVTKDLLKNRIRIKSLNFMRGRTFLQKIIIIDEAQNLTPKQMKTMITRAGPGSKIICLGNIAQIDTPYLTEASSGLTYAVDRFKGWQHNGHITLTRGERSRLADFAERML